MIANQSPTYFFEWFSVNSFQGIISTEISINKAAPWIFLTGENGYGKTSILRALAIGLYGKTDEKQILAGKESKIKAHIRTPRGTRKNDPDSKRFIPIRELATYGPSRIETQSGRNYPDYGGKSGPTYSLFNTDGYLLNIEFDLSLWSLKKHGDEKFDEKFYSVKKILCDLLPNVMDLCVDSKTDKVLYFEKEDANQPREFNELASGNRSIIAMVGDMISRFFKTQPRIVNPKDLKGIVIIDELDLHLHPKCLKKLPGLLSNIFPGIQFIASTHSSIPLLGAPDGSVFLKVNRTREEGITIQRLEHIEKEIKNLLPNTILSSDLFDFEDIVASVNEDINEIELADSYKEKKLDQKLGKQLKLLKVK